MPIRHTFSFFKFSSLVDSTFQRLDKMYRYFAKYHPFQSCFLNKGNVKFTVQFLLWQNDRNYVNVNRHTVIIGLKGKYRLPVVIK